MYLINIFENCKTKRPSGYQYIQQSPIINYMKLFEKCCLYYPVILEPIQLLFKQLPCKNTKFQSKHSLKFLLFFFENQKKEAICPEKISVNPLIFVDTSLF